MDQGAKVKTEIRATVTFPIAGQQPFKAEFPATTLVSTVLQDAMRHFGISDDGQFDYYLTHAGKRVKNEQTLGQVAGQAHAVKFTLIKELVQG